jgi:hypothetical protein
MAKRKPLVSQHLENISREALNKPISFKPRTSLGKKLWRIRRRIVASGQPLLSWEDVKREIENR